MPATDEYSYGAGLTAPDGPGDYAEAVTPHDTNELTRVSRALWVGVSGNVKVTTRRGNAVTFPNLSVGWHPIRARIIWATGTTASSIVAVA